MRKLRSCANSVPRLVALLIAQAALTFRKSMQIGAYGLQPREERAANNNTEKRGYMHRNCRKIKRLLSRQCAVHIKKFGAFFLSEDSNPI